MFAYVSTDRVFAVVQATGAAPYDIPGVELSPEGEFCSFDTFLKRYALEAPTLQQLAAIVRGADTSRLDLTPQPAVLHAISLGLSRVFENDHDMFSMAQITGCGQPQTLPGYCQGERSANGARLTSQRKPVSARAITMRWISLVPS